MSCRCLSHRDEDTAVLFALSRPTILIFDAIRNGSKIEKEEMEADWAVDNGLIFYRQRVYRSLSSPLLTTILMAVQNGTHEGVQKTL